MGEKRTLTIVSVSTEPREWNNKKFWKTIDSDDVEWTVSDERIAEGLRKHKGEAIEFDVNISTKGDRTNRFINGAPSIPELAPAPKGGGGGYRGGGGSSYVPRSAASFAFEQETKFPSFAVSYAHDLVVAGKVEPHHMLDEAARYLAWMKTELSKIVASAPTLDAVAAPTASAPAAKPAATPASVSATSAQPLTPAPAAATPAKEPSAKLREALEIFGGEQRFMMAAAKVLARGLGKADLPKLTDTEIDRVVASKAA